MLGVQLLLRADMTWSYEQTDSLQKLMFVAKQSAVWMYLHAYSQVLDLPIEMSGYMH